MKSRMTQELPWSATREQELIAAVRRGDSAAYTEVYEVLFIPLHQYAVRLVRSHEVADDVVQDVFTRLWHRRASWDVRETIPAYLYHATKNRARDLLRREQRKRPPPSYRSRLLSREIIADEDIHALDAWAAFTAALTQLSPRGKEVLLLSLSQDLTYAEIGERLGIARNTVRVNLVESRRRMYRALLRVGVLDR